MSEADPALVRGAPYPVTNPERIPTPRYHDAEFYQAEVDHLWPHVWQMACRLEQIPNVGDWIEYANVGQSVVVVNTKNGVRAFHNACRHRGVPFVGGTGSDHGNCAKSGFICPFHGWRWNMDGENTFVYGRHMFSEDQLDKADLALRAVPGGNRRSAAPSSISTTTRPRSARPSARWLDRIEAHAANQLRAEWWYAPRCCRPIGKSRWKPSWRAIT